MNNRLPWDTTAAGADGEKTAPAARPRAGRHLIAVMLLTAAVLDLTRCGLVMTAARHPAPTAGLAAAGLAAADLPGTRPGGPPRIIIASSRVIDARWVTSQRVPALGRRIAMTRSFWLEPDT